MFRRIISVLFALASVCVVASANTAIIENIGENRYKAIGLIPEIYNKANSDLSDLRIIDKNGEYVPYFIRSGYQTGRREKLTPEFRTEEKDRETRIYIEGLKNLRLGEITVGTDSMFRRVVEVSSFGIRRELYNLSFGDTVYRDTAIPFDRDTGREDILTLIIYNGDDRPINITGIEVWYYADELVFEGGEGETYTLRFGADSGVKAPVYDIVKYEDEILKGNIDLLEIHSITFEEIQPEPKPEPEQYDFKMIFNIVVMAVAALLGVLILLKLRKNAGTQG